MKSNTAEDTVLVLKGSVWEQLGYPNADEMQRKGHLMHLITETIKRQGLTQHEAGKKVGMSQADVSRLSTGKGYRFSIDRLLTVIHRLGIDIELTQRHDEDGHLVVQVRELTPAS